MTSPIVSVVLPTFNRARLVGGTIDSIRSQTFADWELIVVDDGSTDDTSAVLRAATETDSRIQIVRQRNAGVAGAQNVGLNNARGEFIAFHGDDDFSHPSPLAKMRRMHARKSGKRCSGDFDPAVFGQRRKNIGDACSRVHFFLSQCCFAKRGRLSCVFSESRRRRLAVAAGRAWNRLRADR